MPPLPQCLQSDPITIGNQKYTRSGELRRVLGVSVGSTLEDHSFGVSHPKPIAPVASGEIQNFKESVQYASRKARDRSNMFRESISELERYTEALTSKKRQRADLSSERGGGVNLTKMGSQHQKTNIDNLTQRSDSKTSNSTLSKRIRTSLAETREDSRSAAFGRHQMVTEKDGNPIQTLGGGSVRNEEKTRRLLAGGDGLDQKIKKKRSVGTVGNRVITGERDVKRATLPKANADPKMRFFDTQGFRLKSLPGSSGSNKSEGSSEPTSTGALTMLANEQEGASLRMDHIAERRVVAKGNNRANTQEDCPLIIPNTLIKNKVSRAPRTSSVSALDLSNIQPSSGTFPGSSIHPMTQWVGQRPLKNSRSRRVKIVSPVSRTLEIQVSSEGCLTSDSTVKASAGNSGFQMASSVENSTPKYKKTPDDISSPFGLSESGESRAGENKIKEKGMNSNDFAMAPEKAGPSMLQMRRNKIPTDESGDYVQKQGRNGRGLSLIKPGLPSGREKTENLPITKPVQDMRPNDKSKIKYGRPPSKKQKGRKVLTRVGKQLNIDSSDFGGECDDDHEELYKAANAARNARSLFCSGQFWNKMEPVFASISLVDASYLKQQLNFSEELDKSLAHVLDIDHDMLGVDVSNITTQGSEERKTSRCDEESTKFDAFGGKSEMATPLFQRLLCALIVEDESEESCYQSEAKNISRQCASDGSHCGSCNQIDVEPKDLDRMDSEVESNTFRYPNTSSSLQSTGVWQGYEELFISDVTHTGEICSNDVDQLQPVELSVPCFPSSDGQYQMMSLDDRLLLELQSVGLCPEILPDLAEEDEVINQDILKLEKALYEQNGRKTKNLDKIDKAIEKGRDMERWTIEQVAFDQLIEIAHRKRLACRGSKNSKGAIHKVSKHVSLAFVYRTLGRCRRYEEAGISCFSEPALQNVMFSCPSHENDAQPMGCIVSGTASNTFNKASHLAEAIKSGAVSSASEKYDRHRDDLDRGLLDSFQDSIHSSEQASSKNGPVFVKEKKREMLVNGSISGSSSRASNLDGAVHGGVKGKRSDRERNQSRDQIRESSDSRGGRLSLDNSWSENKTKAKPEQKSTAGGHQDRFISATEPVAGANNNGSKDGTALSGNQDTSKVKESVNFVNLPLDDLSSIDEFGVAGELGGPQDLSSWLSFDEDVLQDHDSIGLEIPMDDLSMIL
ncbi:PREDICTED: uncharacterized protein LOC109325653 isoform X1 [Lupinus angustifolius]|uniref:uncharacterized protein LOC109325653 isoform X1 n=2 Tax=Lupinus angustifolius TaxID=3871 RepID=UPI00092FB651|nr:PREDICTED: uncharacterized protein LOC109325653 isoform X1 [Lupinus angustifolius]XP_019413679.1 PREDICTED: uncharacterized protein LOC109325653 isoform X1 [Lupinus angustifolius]XP_019413680.1 PREDICTED: uncharacterized protein LOC109325653 isoform X1 [Lupinus angustifolius]XP_019413681.1 PREDICTED: uncharacterized protein LOC109325653 isoform X1 [Lupinus angustifolius]